MNTKKLIDIVSQSAVYVPFNGEGIRIDYYDTLEEMEENGLEEDELSFYGTGEETGEEYSVPYNIVDLEKDMFYKLVLVDTAAE